MSRPGAALVAGGVAAVAALLLDRLAVDRAERCPESRWVRTNHAGAPVTLAEGPAAAVAVLVGTAVAAALGAPRRRSAAVAVAAAGSAVVGAYDDLYGTAQSRGFRGHLRSLRAGTVTSGMVKIVGVGVSGLVATLIIGPGGAVDVVIDTALVAGTANLVNLFDLRPGRAAKVIVVLATPFVGVGAAPVLGAAVGSLPSDLGARSMMGDCGANALGAAVATVVCDVAPRSVRVAALLGVAALNLVSERVSFTAVIARTPWLRHLDELGRPLPKGSAAYEGG